MTTYVLYNPIANNKKGEEIARALETSLSGETLEFVDVTKITDYQAFFSDKKGDKIILCGGDGTLNHFVNDTKGIELENIYLYPLWEADKAVQVDKRYRRQIQTRRNRTRLI